MDGRTVVVTGGFGALGRAVAKAAAERGATAVAVDRISEPSGLAQSLGPRALALGGVDLADLSATAKAFESVKTRTGRLDALINIAGGFRWQTLADGDLAVWDQLYQMNVRTAATACKAALTYLPGNGEGRIVNVGAFAATRAGAGMGAYTASKAGVAKLTESLAEELKGKATVNAVLPSIIDTPANRAEMPAADFSKWVSPADLAAVILFLVSPEAKAVTGALIPVLGLV
jgi:NAD(P)-dependent dehydrogenase (short-subunit alcohol dehydrogenase family)